MKKRYIIILMMFLAFAISIIYLCKNYHLTVRTEYNGAWEAIQIWKDVYHDKHSSSHIWQFEIPIRFWDMQEWKDRNK